MSHELPECIFSIFLPKKVGGTRHLPDTCGHLEQEVVWVSSPYLGYGNKPPSCSVIPSCSTAASLKESANFVNTH